MRNLCFGCSVPLSEERIRENWNCCPKCYECSQRWLQECQTYDDEQLVRAIVMCHPEYQALEELEW